MKISDNVSFREATKSATAIKYGIDNAPNAEQLDLIRCAAKVLFEPLREYYGRPIAVTSMYRSLALNHALGGSPKSQHLFGALSGEAEGAIDIDCDVYDNGLTNAEAFNWLFENVEFDQLIWEFGTLKNPDWVHVSFRGRAPRGQVLRAYRGAGNRAMYAPMNLKGVIK